MTSAPRFAALCLVSLVLAGCDNSPTAPPLFTTVTFNGSVTRLATSSHKFATLQTSATVIRINSFSPPTITMGLALGSPVAAPTGGEVCSVTIGQAAVVQGDTFQVPLDAATYCVMIFDIGNVDESVTVSYSLTIQHR